MKKYERTLKGYRQRRAFLNLIASVPLLWIAFAVPANFSLPGWTYFPWIVSFVLYFVVVIIYVALAVSDPLTEGEREWRHNCDAWRREDEEKMVRQLQTKETQSSASKMKPKISEL